MFQIIKIKGNGEFMSVIGDFNDKEQTVFSRTTLTHWKPVLLVSQEHIRIFAYLTAYRDGKGEWFLSVRSFSAPSVLSKWGVQIHLRQPSNKKVENTEDAAPPESDPFEGVTFVGQILSHELSDKQVFESGQYLRLNDHQVKNLVKDRTLFEYSVKLLPKKKVEF